MEPQQGPSKICCNVPPAIPKDYKPKTATTLHNPHPQPQSQHHRRHHHNAMLRHRPHTQHPPPSYSSPASPRKRSHGADILAHAHRPTHQHRVFITMPDFFLGKAAAAQRLPDRHGGEEEEEEEGGAGFRGSGEGGGRRRRRFRGCWGRVRSCSSTSSSRGGSMGIEKSGGGGGGGGDLQCIYSLRCGNIFFSWLHKWIDGLTNTTPTLLPDRRPNRPTQHPLPFHRRPPRHGRPIHPTRAA